MTTPKHFSDPVELPERIIQFGTGILLRGLPDYFVAKANQEDIFMGKILVAKSTPGGVDEFVKQRGRFTTHIRGIKDGQPFEEDFINESISRVISAIDDWPEVLAAATNKDIQIVLSNTTEVGLQFTAESIFQKPPTSFPAKLTAFLNERFAKLGDGSPLTVVIPTELIPGNGEILRDAVLRLATHNNLSGDFVAWLERKTKFCSSLVDRIVTKPSEAIRKAFPRMDPLAIQTEPYRLWAIEGNAQVKKILAFAKADDGVIVGEDIAYYRERKLRLLNGTHTISVCLGFLKGLNTVGECMQQAEMKDFISKAMLDEIVPTLPLGSLEENLRFGNDVLDRFSNPFTEHRLLSITLQATAKMNMRNIPTFFRYAEKFGTTPRLLAKGFAAYLLFMKAEKKDNDKYFGLRKGEYYPIQDDAAPYFYDLWKSPDLEKVVYSVAGNSKLWGTDLTKLPKFAELVKMDLEEQMSNIRL
jgi:tagaturonate reductase